MGVLDGQVVIVTGGAGGIGSAYCRGLAAEGAFLVVADLVDGSKLVAEAEELGTRAISVRVDVSDVASTEAMAAETVDAFGRDRRLGQQRSLLPVCYPGSDGGHLSRGVGPLLRGERQGFLALC